MHLLQYITIWRVHQAYAWAYEREHFLLCPLNTTSITESELVRLSDAMPKLNWNKYFMEAQGLTVEDVYVYQDNQNVILL